LDILRGLVLTGLVLSGFVSVITAALGIVTFVEDEPEDNLKCRKIFRPTAWLFGLFCFLILIIPSSKDFAMVYVIPKVANSQMIQKDIPDIYNLAVSAFKAKLEKELKVKDPL
jgi:hypothetical protein